MNFNTLKQFFKNLLTNFKPMDEESTPEEATTEEAPKEYSPSAFCYPPSGSDPSYVSGPEDALSEEAIAQNAKEKEAGSDHTDEEKKETE